MKRVDRCPFSSLCFLELLSLRDGIRVGRFEDATRLVRRPLPILLEPLQLLSHVDCGISRLRLIPTHGSREPSTPHGIQRILLAALRLASAPALLRCLWHPRAEEDSGTVPREIVTRDRHTRESLKNGSRDPIVTREITRLYCLIMTKPYRLRKFTQEQARAFREEVRSGKITVAALALREKCSNTAMSCLIHGTTYKEDAAQPK